MGSVSARRNRPPHKKKELARLSEEVREASELLRETDPPGYFYVTQRLAPERPSLDTALASEDIDLTDVGARLLNILEAPALSQVHLRNLFEVAFDGMGRATQSERYELLASAYPSVLDGYYPARRIAGTDDVPFSEAHMEYRVKKPDDLFRLLLTLYFSQGKQRIVRCECCFGYFIPKTSRQTIYCDRVFDGKSCKQAGARWKHLALGLTLALEARRSGIAFSELPQASSAALLWQQRPSSASYSRSLT